MDGCPESETGEVGAQRGGWLHGQTDGQGPRSLVSPSAWSSPSPPTALTDAVGALGAEPEAGVAEAGVAALTGDAAPGAADLGVPLADAADGCCKRRVVTTGGGGGGWARARATAHTRASTTECVCATVHACNCTHVQGCVRAHTCVQPHTPAALHATVHLCSCARVKPQRHVQHCTCATMHTLLVCNGVCAQARMHVQLYGGAPTPACTCSCMHATLHV